MDRKMRKLCERKNLWNAKRRQKQRQREKIGEKNYKAISFFSPQLHQSPCIHVPVKCHCSVLMDQERMA